VGKATKAGITFFPTLADMGIYKFNFLKCKFCLSAKMPSQKVRPKRVFSLQRLILLYKKKQKNILSVSDSDFQHV
jgi:hypothetical protein